MPGPEQRATGMPAHAHPALPVAPADPPVALTQGAADVPPGSPDASTFKPPRRNFPLLLAQGGSYGLAGKLAESIKARRGHPARIEGLQTADWVLIDADDVIVHIFRPEVRSFYNLERMWSFGEAPAPPPAPEGFGEQASPFDA